MATIHEPDTALTGSFAGQILRPGDPGFDEARAVWNGMFDRRPAMILRCSIEGTTKPKLRGARGKSLSR